MENNGEKVTVTKLIADIEVILEGTKEKTVETLKPYTQKQLEQDEIYACFELMNLQNYFLNYNKFYAKKDDKGRIKLETDWTAIDENYTSLIPELEKYMEKVFGSQENELSEADDEKFSINHEEQLFKWFSESWEAAGGEHSLVPTFFCFDKEYACHDLKTGEVISEVEAARRLGYEVEV